MPRSQAWPKPGQAHARRSESRASGERQQGKRGDAKRQAGGEGSPARAGGRAVARTQAGARRGEARQRRRRVSGARRRRWHVVRRQAGKQAQRKRCGGERGRGAGSGDRGEPCRASQWYAPAVRIKLVCCYCIRHCIHRHVLYFGRIYGVKRLSSPG